MVKRGEGYPQARAHNDHVPGHNGAGGIGIHGGEEDHAGGHDAHAGQGPGTCSGSSARGAGPRGVLLTTAPSIIGREHQPRVRRRVSEDALPE